MPKDSDQRPTEKRGNVRPEKAEAAVQQAVKKAALADAREVIFTGGRRLNGLQALRELGRKKHLDPKARVRSVSPGKEVSAKAVYDEILDLDPDGGDAKPRKLRKAFERPRPDLPADALVNRIRKVMSLSLPSELIEEVTAEARSQGLDRSAFVERALRAALSRKPKLTP